MIEKSDMNLVLKNNSVRKGKEIRSAESATAP